MDANRTTPKSPQTTRQPRLKKISRPPAPASHKVAIRRKECKTILNRTTICDYSLNCYTGCAHACVYCYARFMQRFHPHPEPWGRFVDVKVNAVDVLEHQLRRAVPGEVFVSSACDGWQPIEAEWKLTRRCCELLLEHGFQVNVLTKSALVLRDLDVFSGRRAQIGTTVTTLDESLRKLWEPNSSTVQDRLRIIEQAHRAGLETAVMFGPLLPFLSDSQSSIDSMFTCAANLGIDVIWVDALNPRPKVWPAVAQLLREKFPELLSRYQQIMFNAKNRADYIAQLRKRVARSTKRFSLADRVAECL
ncbi:MAG: SPL family radical SAM protein [Planctomycetota bacterium]|jgi:DNA repair photolyase